MGNDICFGNTWWMIMVAWCRDLFVADGQSLSHLKNLIFILVTQLYKFDIPFLRFSGCCLYVYLYLVADSLGDPDLFMGVTVKRALKGPSTRNMTNGHEH